METLSRCSRRLTNALGSPVAFLASVLLMLAWLAWGLVVHFDSACQLALSSVTSLVQFPLFFLLLYVQNKDSLALQAKVDALIHGVEAADDALIGLEDAAEDDIRRARQRLTQK